MVKSLLGQKLGMTRMFTEEGRWIEVTLVQAGPCTIIQRKTRDRDGYDAVQVGYGDANESRLTKPAKGHFAKAGVAPKRYLREFRVDPASDLQPGQEIRNDIFKAGDKVDISGTSKGKGFAGVIRRHGMGGGPEGHGSNFHRAPGSVGQSADPSKIIRGKRMPGRMGNEKKTVQNLEIVQVDTEKNLLVVHGCIPGANGGVVVVKQSVKGSE